MDTPNNAERRMAVAGLLMQTVLDDVGLDNLERIIRDGGRVRLNQPHIACTNDDEAIKGARILDLFRVGDGTLREPMDVANDLRYIPFGKCVQQLSDDLASTPAVMPPHRRIRNLGSTPTAAVVEPPTPVAASTATASTDDSGNKKTRRGTGAGAAIKRVLVPGSD